MLSVRRLTGTFRGTSGSGGQDEEKILGILTLWLVEVSYMSSSAMWLALYMPFWLIIVEYIPFRVVLLNVSGRPYRMSGWACEAIRVFEKHRSKFYKKM